MASEKCRTCKHFKEKDSVSGTQIRTLCCDLRITDIGVVHVRSIMPTETKTIWYDSWFGCDDFLPR